MRIGWAAAAAVLLAGGVALAQGESIAGYTQRFMSPCGEPWRAGDGEPYPLIAWFNATDVNHDGAIDLIEFRADHERFFDKLDRDHNGYLDGIEVSFYEKQIAPDVLLGQLYGALQPRAPAGLWGGQIVRAQYGGLGQPPIYQAEGARGPAGDLGASRPAKQPLVGTEAFGLLKDPEPVSSADANLDGRITKAEFLAAADRRFKRLDRNGDGKLVLEELPKPQAQVIAEAEARKHKKR